MPLSAKSLCDERLHKFMLENLSLYEEEQCKFCRDFHSEISSLNKTELFSYVKIFKILGIKVELKNY